MASVARAHHDRVLVLPDVHGDAQQALGALRLAGAVDADGAWAGGAALLVQLGDVLDRGPHSLLLLDYLEGLKVRAYGATSGTTGSAAGGTVERRGDRGCVLGLGRPQGAGRMQVGGRAGGGHRRPRRRQGTSHVGRFRCDVTWTMGHGPWRSTRALGSSNERQRVRYATHARLLMPRCPCRTTECTGACPRWLW